MIYAKRRDVIDARTVRWAKDLPRWVQVVPRHVRMDQYDRLSDGHVPPVLGCAVSSWLDWQKWPLYESKQTRAFSQMISVSFSLLISSRLSTRSDDADGLRSRWWSTTNLAQTARLVFTISWRSLRCWLSWVLFCIASSNSLYCVSRCNGFIVRSGNDSRLVKFASIHCEYKSQIASVAHAHVLPWWDTERDHLWPASVWSTQHWPFDRERNGDRIWSTDRTREKTDGCLTNWEKHFLMGIFVSVGWMSPRLYNNNTNRRDDILCSATVFPLLSLSLSLLSRWLAFLFLTRRRRRWWRRWQQAAQTYFKETTSQIWWIHCTAGLLQFQFDRQENILPEDQIGI